MLWDQYLKILMIEIVSCKWNINGVVIGQGLVLTKWNKPSKNEGSTIYCPLLLKKCEECYSKIDKNTTLIWNKLRG